MKNSNEIHTPAFSRLRRKRTRKVFSFSPTITIPVWLFILHVTFIPSIRDVTIWVFCVGSSNLFSISQKRNIHIKVSLLSKGFMNFSVDFFYIWIYRKSLINVVKAFLEKAALMNQTPRSHWYPHQTLNSNQSWTINHLGLYEWVNSSLDVRNGW